MPPQPLMVKINTHCKSIEVLTVALTIAHELKACLSFPQANRYNGERISETQTAEAA